MSPHHIIGDCEQLQPASLLLLFLASSIVTSVHALDYFVKTDVVSGVAGIDNAAVGVPFAVEVVCLASFFALQIDNVVLLAFVAFVIVLIFLSAVAVVVAPVAIVVAEFVAGDLAVLAAVVIAVDFLAFVSV